MNMLRHLTTPRRLVVGFLVFITACHRKPTPQPAPAPARAPARARPTPPPAAATTAAITTGNSLVRAMHERYGSWYHTMTFVQRTTLVTPSGGEIHQTWYEAMELPGRLRIDTDLHSKSGTLFARDSIFTFSAGKLVRADTGLNELLVLGFDAYAQSSARTEAQLRSLGFDLSRFHEGTWEGKPVFIVGALAGDTMSKQFWVDQKNLLFVRLLSNDRQGHVDIRFNNYQSVGGGWVAAEVLQLVNGRRRLLEEYSDIHANVPLAAALFDPGEWAVAPHWAKASSRP